MRKAYLTCIFIICLIIRLTAQETSGQRILTIKENPDYLYTESKGESWGETEDNAKKMLLKKMQEYLKENNQTADAVSLENTAANAEVIEIDNGGNAYIFCYIHIQEISPDFLITEEVIAKESEKPAKETIEETETEATTTDMTRTTDTDENIRTTDSEILASIIRTENTDDLNTLLSELKERHAIIYGRIKHMTAPEKSYILIFNGKRERVALLDKGADSRKNLITGQKDDRVSNYKGMRAMWFQLFE